MYEQELTASFGRRKRQRARRRKRQLYRLYTAALCGVMALALGALALHLMRGTGRGLQAAADYGAPEYDLSGYVFDAADPLLVLVNNNLPLDSGYAPDAPIVADADTGKQLAGEAAAAYQDMYAAAKKDGVSLVLCSGYRDYAYQADLFEKRTQKYLNKGHTQAEAEQLAQTIVARPGCSEHQTGLAADIVTEKYTALDSGFADTAAYAWLVRYGPDYGFILRYPKDRQAATGIVYEPWHWRYVGRSNAQAITASGLSLEEFLALHTAASDWTAGTP